MIRRGEIWWASLADPRGSEPGFRRPVLVVQADAFNRSRIATVMVATITSNLRLAEAPGNVRLGRAGSGLARDSVVNASQVLTLDRRFLTERIGALSPEVVARVDAGLQLALGIAGRH